jgi:hypothetical protein
MRKIKIKLDQILELISCADDYGYQHDVLFDAFGEIIQYNLTDKEIESYARKIEAMKPYSEEDYEVIKERLAKFKEKYCNHESNKTTSN